MRLTVLGSCGAWPAAGRACAGYLVEYDGFRLLLDVGFAVVPRLLELVPAERLDAVFVSHGHPDHCADLNPLLRARVMRTEPSEPSGPLPVYCLPGTVDAVLGLDRPAVLAGAYDLRTFEAGDRFALGPFRAETRLLAHSCPNAGIRLTVDGRSLTYTGDTGPCSEVEGLASGADLLVADATYADRAPDDTSRYLGTARQAGMYAVTADVGRVLLTHLGHDTDPEAAKAVAGAVYAGPIDVAVEGLAIQL